jgi:hypothetical protein
MHHPVRVSILYISTTLGEFRYYIYATPSESFDIIHMRHSVRDIILYTCTTLWEFQYYMHAPPCEGFNIICMQHPVMVSILHTHNSVRDIILYTCTTLWELQYFIQYLERFSILYYIYIYIYTYIYTIFLELQYYILAPSCESKQAPSCTSNNINEIITALLNKAYMKQIMFLYVDKLDVGSIFNKASSRNSLQTYKILRRKSTNS